MWLASDDGIKFKNSGLKWYEWQENQKSKKQVANSVNVSTLDSAVHFSDSDTESEISTYICAATSSSLNGAWGLDSMCSCYLTPYKNLFISRIVPTKIPIEVANGTTIYSKGSGDVRIQWKNPTLQRLCFTTIHNVLYVPDASISLMSLGMLAKKGHEMKCDSSSMTISASDGQLILQGV